MFATILFAMAPACLPAQNSARRRPGRRQFAKALSLSLLTLAGCRNARPYYQVDYYFIPF